MLMRQPTGNLQFTYQPPFGATLQENGVQFSVFSRSATAMRLVALQQGHGQRSRKDIIEFDRETDRWGDVWSLTVEGNSDAGQLYHFQASGPWDPAQRPAIRFFGPTDRSLCASAFAGTFQRRHRRGHSFRRSVWWSMTILIGKTTDTCDAI